MENIFIKPGKLKIFLGMAPGVGKTFSMLDAAHDQLQRGQKVAVGIVEPDEGKESIEILNVLPAYPPLLFKSNGIEVQELDTASIISSKPDYVAIDRLEHINCPGVKHRFRYQDVEEVLKNGISVFTTLNVHHIEGLINTVFQVTGIQCHETVPDRLFDLADDVELIDMPVDELLHKFRRGGIRLPDYLQSCAHDFYRKSNLIALRELTLRRLARRINCELTEYLSTHSEKTKNRPSESVIAIIEAGQESEQVIRSASKFASDNDKHWIAIVSQPPNSLNNKDRERVGRCIGLVSELGGELVTLNQHDVADGIYNISQEKHVTHVFVGNPSPSIGFWKFRSKSYFDKIVRKSVAIPITVIPSKVSSKYCHPLWQSIKKLKVYDLIKHSKHYTITLGICALLTSLCFITEKHLAYHAIGIIMLLSTIIMSFFFRPGPVITAAVTSAFFWDYIFIPPRFGLIPSNPVDFIIILLFLGVAIATATLITSVQQKGIALREQAHRSGLFVNFSKELYQSNSIDQMIRMTIKHIGASFNAKISFHCFENERDLKLGCHLESTWIPTSSEDCEAVERALQTRSRTGAFTEYNPGASATYYPLVSGSRVEGIMGLRTHNAAILSFEDETLLRMIIQQIATAFEKSRLMQLAEKSKVLAESEKLFKALFNSLSHEFRTPLATICGASSNLADSTTAGNELLRNILIQDIQNSAARMNHQITNLLDMSRIESGHLNIKLEWCDIYDLFDSLSVNLSNEIHQHPLNIEISDNFPLLKIDTMLIGQVFFNITENAIKHSPEGAPVHITANLESNIPVICFEDAGTGFPPEALPRLFEKFFRAHTSTYHGIGLGLSIAKGFIDAHGATIEVANGEKSGARITIKFINTPQGTTPHTEEHAV